MNRIALLLFLSPVLLALNSSPAQAGPSYPLTCHASSALRFNFGFNNGTMIGNLGFKATNAPAAAGVPPGFCAWSDRGFRQNEPTTLYFPNIGLGAGSLSNGSYTNVRFTQLPFVQDLVRNSGQYFVFQVHREGNSMYVDRIGP